MALASWKQMCEIVKSGVIISKIIPELDAKVS